MALEKSKRRRHPIPLRIGFGSRCRAAGSDGLLRPNRIAQAVQRALFGRDRDPDPV
jgi:hypothetical protein